MTKNYHHYITRNIRSLYRRKMIAPAIYLILLLILWHVLPISNILLPQQITAYPQIIEQYEQGSEYVVITLEDLYFTGYTSTRFGENYGYYYYTVFQEECIFVLLSPKSCEEGIPYIEQLTTAAQIFKLSQGYEELTKFLSDDLNWTLNGLRSKVSPYLLHEPAFFNLSGSISLLLYFSTALYGMGSILLCILYILFPVLSPPCRRLGKFGRASALLAEAEEELATLPQLATEDMFITEHYFIEITHSGVAIVPLQEIIWIYKYSTLHKIFWYHFNISYTLHITTRKHLHIQCPKNIKSDIDGIIDYLAEANHNILVGFNEKNRLKVYEMQKTKYLFRKLITFFQKKHKKEDSL